MSVFLVIKQISRCYACYARGGWWVGRSRAKSLESGWKGSKKEPQSPTRILGAKEGRSVGPSEQTESRVGNAKKSPSEV